MKQINYVTYKTTFGDGSEGPTDIFLFYPYGVWDEYKYTYAEAVNAYPLDEYEWVEMQDDN